MLLSVFSAFSTSGDDFPSQLADCLNQMPLQPPGSKGKPSLLKITVFSAVSGPRDYLKKLEWVKKCVHGDLSLQVPVTLVSQPPMDGGVQVEWWQLEAADPSATFRLVNGEQSSALLVSTPELDAIITTQHAVRHSHFMENSRECFQSLSNLLYAGGFDFSDIVRQWNYLDHITGLEVFHHKQYQHYQVFNDQRSAFYDGSNFVNGYPAATGIGMEGGGCVIEAFAIKAKQPDRVVAVKNRLQTDAHSYSTSVLVGHPVAKTGRLTTPKFERGKYIRLGNSGMLFVSGTASIEGELTVHKDDVAGQTLKTLKVIDHLASVDNLQSNHIEAVNEPKLLSYRVYLKHEKDYPVVKAICEKHFGIAKGFIVKADICRDDLLVEIEANWLV